MVFSEFQKLNSEGSLDQEGLLNQIKGFMKLDTKYRIQWSKLIDFY